LINKPCILQMSSTYQNKTNSKFDQDTNLHFNINKCIDNYTQLYEIQAGKTKYE